MPSMSAAAISIAVWIVAADCGCRAMPSMRSTGEQADAHAAPDDRESSAHSSAQKRHCRRIHRSLPLPLAAGYVPV